MGMEVNKDLVARDNDELHKCYQDLLLEAYGDYEKTLVAWPNFYKIPECSKYIEADIKVLMNISSITTTTTKDTSTTAAATATRAASTVNKRQIVPIPLSIMECYRLMSVRDPKTGQYVFYPTNMRSAELKQFQIMGNILEWKEWPNNFELKVNDGTGMIKVHCKKYTDRIDPATVGDYVTILGFLNFSYDGDFIDGKKQLREQSDLGRGLILIAYSIKTMTEKQYADEYMAFINGFFKLKYTAE